MCVRDYVLIKERVPVVLLVFAFVVPFFTRELADYFAEPYSHGTWHLPIGGAATLAGSVFLLLAWIRVYGQRRPFTLLTLCSLSWLVEQAILFFFDVLPGRIDANF